MRLAFSIYSTATPNPCGYVKAIDMDTGLSVQVGFGEHCGNKHQSEVTARREAEDELRKKVAMLEGK